MRITSIKLENFKTFADTQTIQTDHPMICFVGENNTGKTTVNGNVKMTTVGN